MAAVQRKSQIPKAPQRSLVDSIASAPEAATLGRTPDLAVATPRDDGAPASSMNPEMPKHSVVQRPDDEPAARSILQPPVRRRRKPVRIVYTSKMDPELKDWASSFKPEEDFLEVVEQALWILRLGRAGNMAEAVAALERASQPAED